MYKQKEELKFLAALGERKIKSIKTDFELTESELLLIIRLHQRHNNPINKNLSKLLNKF